MSIFSRALVKGVYLHLAGLVILGTLLEAAPQQLSSYHVEDKEEAFLVRRIAEFWKDQDYGVVTHSII